jgi:DnaK suppressor protein
MTPATRNRFKDKLLALKDEMVREGDLEIEPGRVDAAAVGTDEDAQPLTEMSQTIASSRNRERTVIMRQINVALARLENEPEMYGLCVECEEPISDRRLDLRPYVELCVECQQAKDKPRGGARKSLTDYK